MTALVCKLQQQFEQVSNFLKFSSDPVKHSTMYGHCRITCLFHAYKSAILHAINGRVLTCDVFAQNDTNVQ